MYEPFVIESALLVNTWTSTEHFYIYAAIAILVMIYFRHRRSAAIFGLTLIMTGLSVWALKHIFVVPRPSAALIELSSYAFPSGHAALSVGTAVISVWLLDQNRTIAIYFVRISAFLFLLLALLISYSRVVIGVHTWLQVFGGAVVGVVVPFLVVQLVQHFEKTERSI